MKRTTYKRETASSWLKNKLIALVNLLLYNIYDFSNKAPHWYVCDDYREALIRNGHLLGVFFWTSKTFRISKTERFQKQNPWFSKNKNSGNPKTFAPKFLLTSSPDPFVEWLLATGKTAALFELLTENSSKVSENFCLWWQKVLESSRTFQFQKNIFEKYALRKKKATKINL